MRRLTPPGIHQYRSAIVFNIPEQLDRPVISRYLRGLADEIGMELADPGVITGWCEHGLAGWVHITTSGGELMGYPQPDGSEYVTLDLYSCRPYDLDAVIEFTAVFFGIGLDQIAGTPLLTGLS